MKRSAPAQGPNRYLDFTSAKGLCFRMQVVDDPADAYSFTVRVTPLPSQDELDPDSPSLRPNDRLSLLTARERDVALLVAEGFTNDQIANKLYVSLSTVKSHLQNIFAKENVANRTTLVSLLHETTP
ncbi:response regulator transcription factor [Gordonibacter sp.]|uniref:response regulator transcription factor n=1 Tax=Gordonibacter sp. TaxID=1968902 RepID=UPI002FCC24E1